jgi:hypothetical protein
MKKSLMAAIALAGMLMATPAMAMTVGYSNVALGDALQPVAISKTNPAGVFENVTGNVANIRTSPWFSGTTCPSASACGQNNYNSVSAGSSATYLMSNAKVADRNSLTIMWGSPDTNSFPGNLIRNLIQFLDENFNVVDFLTGNTVVANSGVTNHKGFTTVSFSGVNPFKYVRLSDASGSLNAFEFAFSNKQNQGGPETIPVPAGLALLLSGLAGVGFLGRVRAKLS